MNKIYISTLATFLFCGISFSSSSQTISTIAGNGAVGFSGDGGPATAAELSGLQGVGVDALGNIYIADYYNYRVRKVNTSGTISTFAGSGVAGYSGDGGPATAAELYNPQGLAFDILGNIYIADFAYNVVRKVNTAGIISTVAGIGHYGFSGDGGPATAAELYQCSNIALDAAGNI